MAKILWALVFLVAFATWTAILIHSYGWKAVLRAYAIMLVITTWLLVALVLLGR